MGCAQARREEGLGPVGGGWSQARTHEPGVLDSCRTPQLLSAEHHGAGEWEVGKGPPASKSSEEATLSGTEGRIHPGAGAKLSHTNGSQRSSVPQGPSSPAHTLTKVTLTHTWREQRGIILGVTPGGRCRACAELGEWKPVPAALPTWDLTSPMVGTVSNCRVPEHKTGTQHLPVWGRVSHSAGP